MSIRTVVIASILWGIAILTGWIFDIPSYQVAGFMALGCVAELSTQIYRKGCDD